MNTHRMITHRIVVLLFCEPRQRPLCLIRDIKLDTSPPGSFVVVLKYLGVGMVPVHGRGWDLEGILDDLRIKRGLLSEPTLSGNFAVSTPRAVNEFRPLPTAFQL